MTHPINTIKKNCSQPENTSSVHGITPHFPLTQAPSLAVHDLALNAIEQSRAQFDRKCYGLSLKNLWPIYIDFKDHYRGKNCFDKDEPGYRAAMIKGLALVRDHIGDKLNFDSFVKLHDTCVDQVYRYVNESVTIDDSVAYMKDYMEDLCDGLYSSFNFDTDSKDLETEETIRLEEKIESISIVSEDLKSESDEEEPITVSQTPTGYKKHPFSKGLSRGGWNYPLGIVGPSADRAFVSSPAAFLKNEAFQELEKEEVLWCSNLDTQGPSVNYLARFDPESKKVCNVSNHLPIENTVRRINEYIDNYYTSIRSNQNEIEKLQAIVKLCRALEVSHIFPDGNQRTIAFALLTKLLIENDFTPAILRRAELFDGGFTIDEMVKEVQDGMNFFSQTITKQPKKNDSNKEKIEKIANVLFLYNQHGYGLKSVVEFAFYYTKRFRLSSPNIIDRFNQIKKTPIPPVI